MSTVDLGIAPTAAPGAWSGVPRRVGLTRPELVHAAALIGAPLPFVAPETEPAAEHALASKLGRTRSGTGDEAYAQALATLDDPARSLERRGLLRDGTLDPGVAGALGLVAAPRLAIDLDVAVGELRAHSWHRQRAEAAASLSTTDGLVFELAWFPLERWADEIGRAAALPEEVELGRSAVPADLEVAYDLADAVLEALRTGRTDLVPVLTGGDTDLGAALTALHQEARGRLRALVSAVSSEDASPVGVASWTLVADGWRVLRPRTHDGALHLALARAEPAELAAELTPLLAEVTR